MNRSPSRATVPAALPVRTAERPRSGPFEASQPARRSERRLPFRIG